MIAPAPSALAGQALVAIWHDIAPEGLADFYDWHNREHMPERLAIPGFHRGRRYLRVAGDGQEFFNLYEVATFDVLVGPDYLARLNAPTPWTRRVVPHFRNVTRGLCRVVGSAGIGQGGMVTTLRFGTAPEGAVTLRAYLLDAAFPALLAQPGVLAMHLACTDAAGSSLPTAEKQARNNPTDIPSWVLLVEGISVEHLRRAVSGPLAGTTLIRHGAAAEPLAGTYQLEATRLPTAASAG
ncbi:MAG: hypothetical protein ACKODH_13650 [Limisphaerales bacterium]